MNTIDGPALLNRTFERYNQTGKFSDKEVTTPMTPDEVFVNTVGLQYAFNDIEYFDGQPDDLDPAAGSIHMKPEIGLEFRATVKGDLHNGEAEQTIVANDSNFRQKITCTPGTVVALHNHVC